jgi:lysophospholipase L1-like esterase
MPLNPLKTDYTIIVAGDSISRGVIYDEARRRYSLLENCYVGLLRGALKGTVHNLARFGNTVTRGFAKLTAEVSAKKPDIVLLEFGGNDCDFDWAAVARSPEADHQPRTDYARFGQLLREEITRLKDAGITPVLMALPPIDADRYLDFISSGAVKARENIVKWLHGVTKLYWWQERYNAAAVAAAEETGIKIIDVRAAFLKTPDFRALLCADGIHPNAAGHNVIAGTIMEYLTIHRPFLLKAEGTPGA